MINTEILQPLFDTFASTLEKYISRLSGMDVAVSQPIVNIVSKQQVADGLTDRSVIATTVFTQPLAGLSILIFPLPFGAIVPERIISPDSKAIPEKITDLHRSAIKELTDKVWLEASGPFSKVAPKKLILGDTQVAPDRPSNFVNNMPALVDVTDYVAVQFPVDPGDGSEPVSIFLVLPVEFIVESVPECWQTPESAPAPASAPPPQKGAKLEIESRPQKKMQSMDIPRVPANAKKITGEATIGGVTVSKKLPRDKSMQRNLETIQDIPVEIRVELGRGEMKTGNVMEIGPGSVLDLDTKSRDPLKIYANGQLVARGKVVKVGEKFGVQILELVDPQQRLVE